MGEEVGVEDEERQREQGRGVAEQLSGEEVDKECKEKGETHACQSCGIQGPGVTVIEDQAAAIEKGFRRSRSALIWGYLERAAKQGESRDHLHQGRDLGVEAVVMPGKDGVAVHEVVRLIPGCGGGVNHMHQLKGHD